MAELSISDKYQDAFWRLVPIPVATLTGAITVALHPSRIAAAALLLLAVMGGSTEVLMWRRLRLRWAESAAGTLSEPNRRWQMVFAVIFLFVGTFGRAFALAGGMMTDALVGTGLVIAIYAGLIGVDWFSKHH